MNLLNLFTRRNPRNFFEVFCFNCHENAKQNGSKFCTRCSEYFKINKTIYVVPRKDDAKPIHKVRQKKQATVSKDDSVRTKDSQEKKATVQQDRGTPDKQST